MRWAGQDHIKLLLPTPSSASPNLLVMTIDSEKAGVSQLEHRPLIQKGGAVLAQVVSDGDEAFKVLLTEYEPYTTEEEKRVLRKIDLGMCVLMLVFLVD